MIARCRRLLLCLALLCLLLGASPLPAGPVAAAAGDPPPPADYQKMIHLNSTGGQVAAVAIRADGGFAFTGEGVILHAIDLVTTPPNLLTTYDSPPVGGPIQDIFLQGKYAYLAAGSAGLVIVDVADPAAMRVVGRYRTTAGNYAQDVTAAGSRVYLVDRLNGLYVIDVQDPANPKLIYAHDPDFYEQFGIVVAGGRAYTASWSGLYIYDLNRLAEAGYEPTLMKNSDLGLMAVASLDYAGGRVYIGGYDQLVVVDPANTSSPVVARYENQFGVIFYDLAVAGDTLYFAADNNHGVCAAPIAKIGQPDITFACYRRITGMSPEVSAKRVALHGGRLYTAFQDALTIHDLPLVQDKEPALQKVFPLAFLYDAAYDDGLLYLATGSGLVVYNPQNPGALRRYTKLAVPLNQVEIYRTGSTPTDKRYVIASGGGVSDRSIHVIDATNPDAMEEIVIHDPHDYNKYILPKTLKNGDTLMVPLVLKQSGTRLYAATMQNRLFILDLTTLPNSLAELTPAGNPPAIPISGTPRSINTYTWLEPTDPPGVYHEKLYIGLGMGGAAVVDVSDPAAVTATPLDIPTLPPSTKSIEAVIAAGVQADPQVIFAATWSHGVQIYQQETGAWSKLETPGDFIHDLYLRDGYLFAAARDGFSGIIYFDVSDLQNPRLAGFARLPTTLFSTFPFETGDYPRLHVFSETGLHTLLLADKTVYLPNVRR